jgi:hypothetical protein
MMDSNMLGWIVLRTEKSFMIRDWASYFMDA